MLVQFLILLVIVGAVLYVVRLLPIDETVKTIIQVVAIVILVIYAIKLLLPMAGIS